MSGNTMDTYIENTVDEFGVIHKWVDSKIIHSVNTKRGTLLEIVDKPKWGLTCYMNNSVQSCLKDEKIYHEALVHPVMTSTNNVKRVCIIGGGEGATLREVLKFPGVEEVDMYEWDKEVVDLFRNKYTQWSCDSFNDPRVVVIYEDIFSLITEIPKKKYDIIIVDLFDPEYIKEGNDEYYKWRHFIKHIVQWMTDDGSLIMYSGMRALPNDHQNYKTLLNIITYQEEWHGIKIPFMEVNKDIISYKVYIPSFSGESTFILLKPYKTSISFNTIKSHINDDVWKSYITFNY